MEPLLQREGIDVVVAVGRPIRRIMADKLQLEQVLINLISNAAEAMDRNGYGNKQLTLRARNLGDEISVLDNGPGFPTGFDAQRRALFVHRNQMA